MARKKAHLQLRKDKSCISCKKVYICMCDETGKLKENCKHYKEKHGSNR